MTLTLIWLSGSLISYILFKKYLKLALDGYYSVGDRMLNIFLSIGFSWFGVIISTICLLTEIKTEFLKKQAKW